MHYIICNRKFGVFLLAMIAWYVFISYYIEYDITHGSPLSKAFYNPSENDEQKEFEKNEIFKKYSCASVFEHMDHMDIHDTSVNPITLLHAMYHHRNAEPYNNQHQHYFNTHQHYFNTTRVFKCLHMKLKFIKDRKKPYGQISTIAISVITPITGYVLTVMVSIAYTQFKESIQIYRDILGQLMTIVIILSGLKQLNVSDGTSQIDGGRSNGFLYRVDRLFGSIIGFPVVLLRQMSRESNDTIQRTLGIMKTTTDINKAEMTAREYDKPSESDVIEIPLDLDNHMLHDHINPSNHTDTQSSRYKTQTTIYLKSDRMESIESHVTSILLDVYNIEQSISYETCKSVGFMMKEMDCVREKLRKLFELSFGLQSLYQTRLPENLHRIITLGGLGVYILMIPAFWSIYGWIFGTIVIMVCAICFIAVLEGIDRMNPIFDTDNPMYHELFTENQMTTTRMKRIYCSSHPTFPSTKEFSQENKFY